MTGGHSGARPPEPELAEVRDFWQARACGGVYAHGESLRERLEAQARARYALEPCLRPFARLEDGRGQDVLEIGVGMGADHLEWALASPRSLTGIDLTPHAVDFTRARLALRGLGSRLLVTNSERLRSRTPLVGVMLWLRYALLASRPGRSLRELYARYLESPGTKAYTPREARAMFLDFEAVHVTSEFSPGDLLLGAAGQRHRGTLLAAARRVYPRSLVRRLFEGWGLHLLIEATRPPAEARQP